MRSVLHSFEFPLWLRACVVLAGLGALTSGTRSLAHTLETSYCRIHATAEGVVISIAFDFSTLGWIAAPDADEDGLVTSEELYAVARPMENFLQRTLAIRQNGRELILGSMLPLEWPARAHPVISADEFHRHFAIFRFRISHPAAAEPVELSIGYFKDLGKNHTVLGTIATNGREERLIFTENNSVRTFTPVHFTRAME